MVLMDDGKGEMANFFFTMSSCTVIIIIIIALLFALDNDYEFYHYPGGNLNKILVRFLLRSYLTS